MFTATLLTNPATPVLDRTTVESLRNAWGGGNARWLDPGVAAAETLLTVGPLSELLLVEVQNTSSDGQAARPWVCE